MDNYFIIASKSLLNVSQYSKTSKEKFHNKPIIKSHADKYGGNTYSYLSFKAVNDWLSALTAFL